MNEKLDARTKWSYCIGATGRDAAYALVSMYLILYVQYTMNLTSAQFAVISAAMVVCMIWEDAVLHLFPAAVQHILNPGDHIRAVLALGVQGAGLGEQGSGFPGQQIGNHGGGADVDGKRVFVGPIRSRLDALTLGQNSGGGGLGKGHGTVRPHNSLTGQDFCPGLYCDFAFPAGPVAAAGCVGLQACLNFCLKQRGPLFHRDGDPGRQKCDAILLHRVHKLRRPVPWPSWRRKLRRGCRRRRRSYRQTPG